MKKCVVVAFVLFSFLPKQSKAWGYDGHAIVGQIAMSFVKDDVKQNILKLLDTMSVSTAANWMDIMKSNSDYDFMRSWHYLDFAKDQLYQPSNNENIVTKLQDVFSELKHRNVLCAEQQKFDLLLLFHLMGDLHMPLHTGYDYDMGGNKRMVQYDTMKTHNLHRFWDEDIIALTKITLEDCLNVDKSNLGAVIEPIDFEAYMKSTRSLLDSVYNFPDYTISEAYLQRNASLVKRQLLIGGLRLAAVLNKLFTTPAPKVEGSILAANFKNGIDAKDAGNFIGKKVTACSRVYGVKNTGSVTFINLGDKYPNSPLTVVISGKDRDKFTPSIEELFNGKNICVTGKVMLHQNKAEIDVTDPDDIIVQ